MRDFSEIGQHEAPCLYPALSELIQYAGVDQTRITFPAEKTSPPGDGKVEMVGDLAQIDRGELLRPQEPLDWTDAHNLRSWADGGTTSLDNLVLLCRHHHRLIHGADWSVRMGADRLPEFIPPPWADPQQRPRRNLYHQRT